MSDATSSGASTQPSPGGHEPVDVPPGRDIEPIAFAGPRRRLDPAYLSAHMVANAIFTGIVLVCALATVGMSALTMDDGPGWMIPALSGAAILGTGLIGWLGHRWGRLSYEHTSYAVSPLGLEIQRGVVWRRAIAVPRSRIQHTDVIQGPIQRAYGLATLVVVTAGVEHAQVDLPGLALATASSLRLDLLRRDGSSLPADAESPGVADVPHA